MADDTTLILKFSTGYRVAVVENAHRITEYRDNKVVAQYFDDKVDYETLDQAFEKALEEEAVYAEQNGSGTDHGVRVFVWDGIVNAITFEYYGIMDMQVKPDSATHAETVWGIRFPDLPGCYGGAGSFNEVILDATSAAEVWFKDRLDKKMMAPPRSTIDTLEVEAGETAVVLSVMIANSPADPDEPIVNANISIHTTLIDHFAGDSEG